MKVQNYALRSQNGKHIRIATKVVLSDGREIKFMERLYKNEAIEQAKALLAKEAS